MSAGFISFSHSSEGQQLGHLLFSVPPPRAMEIPPGVGAGGSGALEGGAEHWALDPERPRAAVTAGPAAWGGGYSGAARENLLGSVPAEDEVEDLMEVRRSRGRVLQFGGTRGGGVGAGDSSMSE